MLEYLPLDLRPFVVLHDFEVDLASYPELTKQDADHDTHPTLLWVRHLSLLFSPKIGLLGKPKGTRSLLGACWEAA